MVHILIDHREANARIPNILKKFCTTESAQLPVGDYILSDRVCVERKSSSDFLQSIVDRRLFPQLDALRESFDRPLLIVEGGHPLSEDRAIHPNAIRGALASITIDYQFPIIWTETQMDTAHQLLTIANREQVDEKRPVSIRGKRRAWSHAELQEFLIAGIPKINTAKSRALLAHFGTPERIFTASEKDLKTVTGIGPTLAKQIRQLMTQDYLQ